MLALRREGLHSPSNTLLVHHQAHALLQSSYLYAIQGQLNRDISTEIITCLCQKILGMDMHVNQAKGPCLHPRQHLRDLALGVEDQQADAVVV